MSITLPVTDMTGKTVGQSGQIKVKTDATNWNVPGLTGKPATIRVLNESGCGLKVWTDTNQINEWLGAGAWIDYEIEQGTLYLNWYVQYTIPNPPANSLMVTFYSPGEKVPPMATLGNSPIGGGTTTAVTGSTLSNEVNSTPALIVDIGQVANTNLINIFSDGSFTWNIVIAGVVHTLLKGKTSGNLLQLGSAADFAEFLGGVFVDGGLSVAGTASFGVITSGGGITLSGGDITLASHLLKTVGQLQFNSVGSLSGITTGTFTPAAATGTQSHGMVATPDTVILGCEDPTSTTTYSVTSRGATTFGWHVNNTGVVMRYTAIKF
jgi:hypothetical protein